MSDRERDPKAGISPKEQPQPVVGRDVPDESKERHTEIAVEVGHQDDPLLQVAMELERVALHDDYFIDKKLYPNIDFYSGITLRAMGFPNSMFTVLFAVARTVGWIAQWKEMIEDPQQKIGRPRQLYTGATRRDYVPISTRKA